MNVKELSSNPILRVDFGEVRRTAQRHLILTEDHISVDDPDTRDPSDDTKVDAVQDRASDNEYPEQHAVRASFGIGHSPMGCDREGRSE